MKSITVAFIALIALALSGCSAKNFNPVCWGTVSADSSVYYMPIYDFKRVGGVNYYLMGNSLKYEWAEEKRFDSLLDCKNKF